MKSWKSNIGKRVKSSSILDEWNGERYVPVVVEGIISGYRSWTDDSGMIKRIVKFSEVSMSSHSLGGMQRMPWQDGVEFDVTFAQFEVIENQE